MDTVNPDAARAIESQLNDKALDGIKLKYPLSVSFGSIAHIALMQVIV